MKKERKKNGFLSSLDHRGVIIIIDIVLRIRVQCITQNMRT